MMTLHRGAMTIVGRQAVMTIGPMTAMTGPHAAMMTVIVTMMIVTASTMTAVVGVATTTATNAGDVDTMIAGTGGHHATTVTVDDLVKTIGDVPAKMTALLDARLLARQHHLLEVQHHVLPLVGHPLPTSFPSVLLSPLSQQKNIDRGALTRTTKPSSEALQKCCKGIEKGSTESVGFPHVLFFKDTSCN